MKIRTDFVTNSSSSSFVFACRPKLPKLNDRQKEQLLNFVLNKFTGGVVLTPASSEEDIQETFETLANSIDSSQEEQIRKSLSEGKFIYAGRVSFHDTERDLRKIYQSVWKILEEEGNGHFDAIEVSLDF